MNTAVRATIGAFGVINTIAAFEHGLGEALQGNTPPGGTFILSWPNAPFFQIHGGEPAMTLIPNLLVSGILSMLLSLAFLAFATWYSGRAYAGPVLILISILLLLVGGGFGPPILGLILGAALSAATLRKLPTQGARLSGWVRFLGRQWPWLLIAGLSAWLLVFPGLNVLDYALRITLPDALVYAVIFSALGQLLLAVFASLARDRVQQAKI